MPINTETRVITRTIAALKASVSYILHQGGTSSGKTYGILYALLFFALRFLKQGSIVSIVSENLPHLKRGAITDFKNILNDTGISAIVEENKSDHKFMLPGRILFEFFSTDNEQKAKSGKRDILFINEANGVPWSIANQLMIRTRGAKIFDWNPSGKFWLHKMLLPALEEKDYVLTKTTYRDNKSNEKGIIESIERLKLIDQNLYDVYGLGVEGKGTEIIYPIWELVDSFPDTKNVSFGLDFGFTNHPSVGTRCAMYDGALWFDQIFYERGLSNKKIFQIFDVLPYDVPIIFADSAEPKSIDELKSYGLPIRGAFKGKDSKKFGIDRIKTYPIKITKSSVQMIDEIDAYKWIMIDGKPTNVPVDKDDHAMDSILYGVQGLLNKAEPIRPVVKRASSYGFTDMGI